MSNTRAFKSGNSQAVRIPAEMAYADMSQELTITRMGDVITIYPARGSIKEMVAKLRAMPNPSEIELRDPIEMPDRDGDMAEAIARLRSLSETPSMEPLERTEMRETDWD
jgi:antitoxin VapB